MGERAWEPGDVALLGMGSGGSVPVRAIFNVGGKWYDGDEYIDPSYGPHWVRPLVVIDPEDEATVDRLRRGVMGPLATASPLSEWQAALRALANPQPPKPEEPKSFGALVVDEAGGVWVRRCDGSAYTDMSHPWLLIASHEAMPSFQHERSWDGGFKSAVKVLSEGVAP